MSRDHRKDGRPYYNNRDRNWDRIENRDRDRDRDRDRGDYRGRAMRKRSRTPPRRDDDKRRSRSPRKSAKDHVIDENILSEISKLPEPSELWDNQFQESSFGAPPPGFQPVEVFIYLFTIYLFM